MHKKDESFKDEFEAEESFERQQEKEEPIFGKKEQPSFTKPGTNLAFESQYGKLDTNKTTSKQNSFKSSSKRGSNLGSFK